MTERERLIELICKANDEYPSVPLVNGCRESFMDFLSDHLLANGVIVPPCKVGDRVYEICEIANAYLVHKCVGFQFKKNEVRVITEDGFAKSIRTLKFSREEAEKALAERSKG